MTNDEVHCSITINIGDMCIHSKKTFQCKTIILYRQFEGNMSVGNCD